MNQKCALVLGASGFIGNHLVRHLIETGWWVRAVDHHAPYFSESLAQEYLEGDLLQLGFLTSILDRPFDVVFQMAAKMGGARYFNSALHDAEIMHDAYVINAHVLQLCVKNKVKTVFFPSSSYVYPNSDVANFKVPQGGFLESAVLPANPVSAYGWSKLATEQLYLAFQRNYGLNIRIARLSNVYGPEQHYEGIKAKLPSQFCALAVRNKPLSISGNGEQRLVFLYINDCLDGIMRLLDCPVNQPINLTNTLSVSLNELAGIIEKVVGSPLDIQHDGSPQKSNSRILSYYLMKQTLDWLPQVSLEQGIKSTYEWVANHIASKY